MVYLLTVIITAICLAGSHGVELSARFSENGVHGDIRFGSNPNGEGIAVAAHLLAVGVNQITTWSWKVHRFPVDYTNIQERCTGSLLGESIMDLDELFGPLTINETGLSKFSLPDETRLSLTGIHGVWGRSILLTSEDGRTACATVAVSGRADEKVAEARFLSSELAGSVYFRWVGSHASKNGSRDHMDSVIITDLYRAPPKNVTKAPPQITQHDWKIYVTDILDSEHDKSRGNCNFLQVLFSPDASKASDGDLGKRLGKVQVAEKPASARMVYRDPDLNLSPGDLIAPARTLYVVLLDSKHTDSFLACAKIRLVPPIKAVTTLNSKGVKGKITLTQRSRFDPTIVSYNVTFPNDDALWVLQGLKIHQMPPPPAPGLSADQEPCNHTGAVHDPLEKGHPNLEAGFQGQDKYAVGDLSSKLIPHLPRLQRISHRLQIENWDVFLPLQGRHSVVLRPLVMHRLNDSSPTSSYPWVCGPFNYFASSRDLKLPLVQAEAVFRYPLTGRVVFRQLRDDYYTDTTIIVESLVHADGYNNNDTMEHRWMVTAQPPGKDYYNWTARCVSAGSVLDPFRVVPDSNSTQPDDACTPGREGTCRVGDLTARQGTLNIAGRKLNSEHFTRRLLVDSHLPLSGPASVIGRSLVIFDDFGPKARGERLACSKITSVFRRKGVARTWLGNGKKVTPASGKIEILQQSEYDGSDIEIHLEGLDDVRDYQIHQVPVLEEREFPCEDSTLNGLWTDKKEVDGTLSPGVGTADQHQLGDLSGKFGTLENITHLDVAYNDSTMPLFGPWSILGRSIVISKKKNIRWACSSIERGYSPSEARELRAIASFHHPNGFAYGYIKMTQLIHSDGSQSETVLEVNVRHPGKYDKNMTFNHNWAIYVNPVGVDATVKVLHTRCTAAGYIWNPYYTQLADPRNDELYERECGRDNPLRCYVGDISGRLGPINLGGPRTLFSDSNFPLEGKVSALGKSIVILNKDFGGERFACANIEPDYDIVKYANIDKPPRFVVAQFIEDVREVMGVPEWMLTVDSRKTKILYGGSCIQFLLHFKGPIAHVLEQDFGRLLNGVELPNPSLSSPGFVPPLKRKKKLPYKVCGSQDLQGRKSSRRTRSSSAQLVFSWSTAILFIPTQLFMCFNYGC